nr:putative 2OG-Fe(II) oxygenase [Caulobacter sp. 602-2]
MVAGDYNPAHFHQGCLYSSVGFLRVPPGYEAEFAADKARQNTAGCLQFIDSRSAVGAKNLFTVKPVVGDFYLWPSWMLHCVYPFRSPGVRRSMAINLALA